MRLKPMFLLVAALAALPAPCGAALAEATDTTVTVVQPALEVVILSDGLRFGAGRTTEAFYDSAAGLTLQVHDPASDGQVTGNAFQLYLPGNTPPGTYRGDLTVTIARGL